MNDVEVKLWCVTKKDVCQSLICFISFRVHPLMVDWNKIRIIQIFFWNQGSDIK